MTLNTSVVFVSLTCFNLDYLLNWYFPFDYFSYGVSTYFDVGLWKKNCIQYSCINIGIFVCIRSISQWFLRFTFSLSQKAITASKYKQVCARASLFWKPFSQSLLLSNCSYPNMWMKLNCAVGIKTRRVPVASKIPNRSTVQEWINAKSEHSAHTYRSMIHS